MSFLPLRAAAPFALVLTGTLSAFSHATVEPREAAQNSYQRITLRVPHGCKGEPTTSVRIDIPEGLLGAKPMPKAGWTLETTKAKLARPYTSHGREITEGVNRITWSGGNLPDGHFDEFVFMAQISEALPAGKPLYIPATQTCPKGEAAWTQVPVEGVTARLETPAPAIRILAQAKTGGDHAGHGAAPAAVAASPMKVEQVWTRATPGGAKVAGGFMRITNTGSVPDRLVGGSAEISNVFEVHEMKHEGGMMKMRALEAGLEIKPGETVELKPGSYHVMFIDLKAPIKEGDVVKGELKFEKAGTVKVEFKAGAMGGAKPASGHGH